MADRALVRRVRRVVSAVLVQVVLVRVAPSVDRAQVVDREVRGVRVVVRVVQVADRVVQVVARVRAGSAERLEVEVDVAVVERTISSHR